MYGADNSVEYCREDPYSKLIDCLIAKRNPGLADAVKSSAMLKIYLFY